MVAFPLESGVHLLGDLDAGAATIGLTGKDREGGQQPIDTSLAEEIVRGAQPQVFGHVTTTGSSGASLGLGERLAPCFVKLAHGSPSE
jgi:hypothetical protein